VWQSTLFAVMVAILIRAFRNNRASIRYGLWFSASFKFLVPFALLTTLGGYLGETPPGRAISRQVPTTSEISFTAEQFTQPFSTTSPPARSTPGIRAWAPIAAAGLWVCGFAAIALIRLRGWLRIRKALRSSAPTDIQATVEVRSSPGLLEPGVVGWWRPVLLLPVGIADRLTTGQLAAVLAHEQCHVRRRDNLFASVHMVVEAIFWFHPLVWWIGARLVEERERACDEEVVRLGNDPREYAEGIVTICKSYVESPLACVAGISGASLQKRIEAIVHLPLAQGLGFGRKVLLAAAGVAVVAAPISVGVLDAPPGRAQSAGLQRASKVARIEPAAKQTGGQSFMCIGDGPSIIYVNMSLREVLRRAYEVQDYQLMGPEWMRKARLDVHVEAPQGTSMEERYRMFRALLGERLHLAIHKEIKETALYSLVVAHGGPKLRKAAEIPTIAQETAPYVTENFSGGDGRFRRMRLTANAMTLSRLASFLWERTGKPVVDRTGQSGRYEIDLDFTRESVGTALRDQLGLGLEEKRVPLELIVIDRIEWAGAGA